MSLINKKEIRTPSGVSIYLADFDFAAQQQVFSPDQAIEDLIDTRKILESSGLTWGISFGTLLGAVRGSDFIEYDTDVDVALLSKSRDVFIDLLPTFIDAGFSLVRFQPEVLSLTRGNGYVDFYFFNRVLCGYRVAGFYFPKRFMRFDSRVLIRGHEFPSHDKPEKLMSHLYGQDWQIPKRNFPAISRIQLWKSWFINLFPVFSEKIGELRGKAWLSKYQK